MENISQMSLLEVALEIMEEKGGIVNIYDLINAVFEKKGLTDKDSELASKLYIDITTSSKFVYMGEDNWDLKSRQSLDQFDKDGASFNPKDSGYDEDEEDLDEDSLSDEDEDEDEDEESSDDEDDEDESSEDESSESDEDVEYESDEDEESSDEDEDEDDSSIDEDKYNKYMDDYEDLYEN